MSHPLDGDVRVVSKRLATRTVRGAAFRSYKVELDVRRRGRWVPLTITADAFGEADLPDHLVDEVERRNVLHAVRHYRSGAKPNGARLKRTKRACSARGRKLKRSGDPKAAARLARYCPPPGRRKANAAAAHRVYVRGPGWWDAWTVQGGARAAMAEARHAVEGRREVVRAVVSKPDDEREIGGYTNRDADGNAGRVRKLGSVELFR